MSTKKGRKEGEESKEGKGRERKGGRKEGEGGKEGRKEGRTSNRQHPILS